MDQLFLKQLAVEILVGRTAAPAGTVGTALEVLGDAVKIAARFFAVPDEIVHQMDQNDRRLLKIC